MSEPTPRPRRSKAKNTYTTKSGKTIKLNQSLGDKSRARKEAKARRKAAYLSTLPKEKWKRVLYRLHPKRVFQYWFSRDGAIMALKIIGIGLVVVFLLVVGLFAYFRKDLPKIKDISSGNFGGSITYYDRSGQTVLWQDYDAIKRVPVKGDQISQYMKEATIAIEDKDFYNHGAFDVKGIMRAGVNDLKGGARQGGSTITQQLVKLDQGWTNDRTITRKVKELILAVELEREYTKDDILTGYLNIAPYGNVDYGVESASRDYFGISAKDLSLPQAAMLAAIPKAPTLYSPFSSPTYNESVTANYFGEDELLGRQQYILDQMAKQGYITKEEAKAAKEVDILAQVKPLQPKYAGIKAPYFVLAAKQELQNKFGSSLVKRGGWKVTTTLDMGLQNKADELVASNATNVTRRTGGLADQQAVVMEDVPTGQIVALVGGRDFNDAKSGKINYAASSLIPPGSSFKPYDYAVFIDNNTNVGAGSVLYDTQGAIPGYPCTVKRVNKDNPGNCLQDYDFRFPGPVTLRYALGGSRNVPAVKAMLSAVPNDTSNGRVNSINKVINTASDLMANPYLQKQGKKAYNCYAQGIDINNATDADIQQCFGAAAIGDGAFLHLDDHVNGIASLARLGNAIPRTYLLEVTTATGKSIHKWEQPQGKQVLKQDSAYIVNDMAADPNASYLPGTYKYHNQKNGWKFAIKTGTTNYGYDGLMAAWSAKYAVISWVGHHTRNQEICPNSRCSMEQLTQPLTRGLMEAGHANLAAANWTKPTNLKTLPAFVIRSKLSRLAEVIPSTSTDLFPSWYQAKNAAASNETIDKVSGKLATSCTPALAKQNTANSNAASWNVDVFVGGSASNKAGTAPATGNDDVHNCADVQPTLVMTVTDSNGDPASQDGSGNYECFTDCKVVVAVTKGTHPLSDPNRAEFPGTVNLTVNGQVVQTQAISDSGNITFTYTPAAGATGTVQMGVQVIDSVLYTGTDSKTVAVAETDGG
jgi:membrane peptidoglycan carboxypeptidase